MTLVSIVILTKNAAAFLPETLPAIFSQQVDFEYEVLAVDSGSQDSSLELLSRYPVRVIQIPPESFNHGETRNLGARHASPESQYVVFLSHDALPANSSWLSCLIEPLINDPEVAGAFSRHIPRPGANAPVVRQLVQLTQSGGSQRLVKRMPNSSAEYEANKFYYVFFSNTSSVLRKSVWEKLPFPKADFAEDAIWADKILRAGYKIVFEPDSMIMHSHNYSLVEQFRQNVDHAYAMNQLFHPDFYHDNRVWFHLFAGLPVQVGKDIKFVMSDSTFKQVSLVNKFVSFFVSPAWHFATMSGSWVGAHVEKMPSWLKGVVSRQERIKRT
ncbi:MAG TPA: glycosyltransferase [Anaerolineales bacterium]|nr:glycosyltransferase [Anaerolineales bacterium]